MMIKSAFLLAFCIIIGAAAQGCVSDSPSFYGYAGHLLGVDDMESVQLDFDFDNPATKKCPKCLELKPGSDFHKCSSKKDGLSTYCKDCDSLLRKQRYYANQEKEIAGAAARRQNNAEQRKAYYLKRRADPVKRKNDRAACKRYHENNRDKIYEIQRAWRQSTPEKQREISRRNMQNFRKNHWDKAYAQLVKYRSTHKEQINEGNARRKCIERGNGGSYTKQQWQTLCLMFNNCCACCGQKKRLTVDHITPVTMGGTSFIDNLQPLCGSCNSRKHAKAIDYRNQAIAEWAESEMEKERQAA